MSKKNLERAVAIDEELERLNGESQNLFNAALFRIEKPRHRKRSNYVHRRIAELKKYRNELDKLNDVDVRIRDINRKLERIAPYYWPGRITHVDFEKLGLRKSLMDELNIEKKKLLALKAKRAKPKTGTRRMGVPRSRRRTIRR
jgi:hypothetical protein